MRKKPDLLAVLAFVVALGVVASSLAQGMFNDTGDASQIANVSPTVNQGR